MLSANRKLSAGWRKIAITLTIAEWERSWNEFDLVFGALVVNPLRVSTILPNIWLFSMYSWAVRISFNGNVWSMIA